MDMVNNKSLPGLLIILLTLSASLGCTAFKTGGNQLSKLLGTNQSTSPSDRKYSDYQTSHGPQGSGARGTAPSQDFELAGRNPNRMVTQDWNWKELSTTVQARMNGRDQQKAEQYFQEGQDLYDRGVALWEQDQSSDEGKQLLLKSARSFRLASSAWPDSALEQDSLFMVGEAQFFAHHYVQANRAYEQLVAKYPGTKHMDLVQTRRFKIAEYWLDLARDSQGWSLKFGDEKRPAVDLRGQARRVLHNIRLDDPTGKIADDATLALANSYFESQKFADAADTYEDLRRTYPGSQHQFHAHLFELKARLASYRGANYDGTQLIKAERILKQMLIQFPDHIQEHRDYLDTEAGNIRTMLADRDYQLGRYYENRNENGAARIYYQQVADKFDGTELAEQARGRIAELEGSPVEPVQRAAWLVNLFPEPKSTKSLIAPGSNGTIFR